MKKIISISCILLILVGCGKETDQPTEHFTPTFLSKVASIEVDDGWVYSISINCDDLTCKKINNVSLSGNNIKYKTLDADKGIPILDQDGNIVDCTSGVMPSLFRIEPYASELNSINELLTRKKYQNAIALDNLEELKISKISKQMIIDLYNEALSKHNEFGRYGYLGSNCYQVKDSQEGILQVAYLIEYGNIDHINIEYIYSDGRYLSDIANSNLNSSEAKIQIKIDDIEKEIIEKQNHKIHHEIAEIRDFDENLDILLKRLVYKKESKN